MKTIERDSVLLTRAQCTRNLVVLRCWPDPAGHVWPGRPACHCRVCFSGLIASPCHGCLCARLSGLSLCRQRPSRFGLLTAPPPFLRSAVSGHSRSNHRRVHALILPRYLLAFRAVSAAPSPHHRNPKAPPHAAAPRRLAANALPPASVSRGYAAPDAARAGPSL